MTKYLCEECKNFVGKHSIKKLGKKWLCKDCFKKRNEVIKRKRKEDMERLMKEAENSSNERKKELEKSQDLVSNVCNEKFPNAQEKW